jgi:hypothetical protein
MSSFAQVMAHAQHFLGSNAWVPTVRESVKANPQPATGLPRIAATMGLDDQMNSMTSAILQSPSAAVAVASAVRESKGEDTGSSSSSNERLPDSASYHEHQKPRAGQGAGGWQRLCTNSLVVHSLAPANGEAVPLVQPRREENDPIDSISFDSSAYKMVVHHDGNVFRLVPVDGGQGVSETSIGAAQPGALQGATPKSFTINTGANTVSRQAPLCSPIATRPASPPWFDPARAARAGFKGRVTFHIGSPRSDVHESPSAAATEGKSRDTSSLFDAKSRDLSNHFEGAGNSSSRVPPTVKETEILPLVSNAPTMSMNSKFAP